jgi:hypothetical protein
MPPTLESQEDTDSLSFLPNNLIILDVLRFPLPPLSSVSPDAMPAAFFALRSTLSAASRATSVGRPGIQPDS